MEHLPPYHHPLCTIPQPGADPVSAMSHFGLLNVTVQLHAASQPQEIPCYYSDTFKGHLLVWCCSSINHLLPQTRSSNGEATTTVSQTIPVTPAVGHTLKQALRLQNLQPLNLHPGGRVQIHCCWNAGCWGLHLANTGQLRCGSFCYVRTERTRYIYGDILKWPTLFTVCFLSL